MKKQPLTTNAVLAILSLAVALGLLARSAGVRAQLPERGNEEPSVPTEPQQQTDNPNERASAPRAEG